MIEGVTKTLQILEVVREHSIVTVAGVSKLQGWNKASASRYLKAMAEAGWLENVRLGGEHPRYVLGRKALEFGVDLRP